MIPTKTMKDAETVLKIHEVLFLSLSANRKTSLAMEENERAVSCISVVFMLIPCQKQAK